MPKPLLIMLIKQYTSILNDIEKTLRENAECYGEEPYMELYALGNDISQKLDDLKHELMYA